MSLRIEDYISAGSIPPFVYCYPTRSAYRPISPDWTVEKIFEEDFNHSPTRDLNLYIHVPFCRYKCGFCNLYTVICKDEDIYDAYTSALCTQIKQHESVINSRRLRTVYIGGGTPSLLSIKHFERIFLTLDEVYPNWRNTVEEVAVEATPDSITNEPSKLSGLISLGLTRVNMGVQSLRRDELREAGRIIANENVIHKAFEIIKAHNLPNLSTDLIMGFAGQTDQSWQESVDELVSLEPETISTYFLTIRPDAWFSTTAKYQYMRDESLYNRYDYARDTIESAGYVQESNVRYKKLGRGGYQQKVLQFHGIPVLGLGAGARTYTNTVDYLVGGSANPNLGEVNNYMESVKGNTAKPISGFVYDDIERIRKRLALDMFDLDLRELEKYQFSKYAHEFEPILREAEKLGLLNWLPSDRLQLTREGFKYRDIISWSLYSPNVVSLDKEFYQRLHNANQKAVVALGKPRYVSGLSATG